MITYIFSGVALALSIVSLALSRRTWRETYRPIVIARIRTFAGGNVAVLYELVVENTGNRPATNVRLTADPGRLRGIVMPNCSIDTSEIFSCFDEKFTIPVLANGRETSNAFGKTSDDRECMLVDRARLPIVIRYNDLEGHSYESRLDLFIFDTSGFAGMHYKHAD